MSAPNRRKAAAVQAVARTTIAISVVADGTAAGHWVAAIGANTTAHRASDTAMIPIVGRLSSRRARMAGPNA